MGSAATGRARIALERLTDEELLDFRLCDLPVRIEGTHLEERVAQLHAELEERDLRIRPHVWLSEEWFSPDGVPGFAIPFYLAHPRLMRLERKQVLEVEGGTARECMGIMRHEAGHALDNAFRFRARRRWRELFGLFSKPYPQSYQPEPTSRDYVLHLGAWYAQAHPAEDFAETFAVWLASPPARWRKRYAAWGALGKLEYVNRLAEGVAGMKPLNRRRDVVRPLSQLTMTLREHYRRKREYYAVGLPSNYDRDLKRVFAAEARANSTQTAAQFLRSVRRELVQAVAEGTGVHQYTIDQILLKMIDRCKLLRLRLSTPEEQAARRVLVMLTVQTSNVIHMGYHRIAL
jgi:Putative zinc-binding metallo-peptidase